jgi:hypothetical protein
VPSIVAASTGAAWNGTTSHGQASIEISMGGLLRQDSL